MEADAKKRVWEGVPVHIGNGDWELHMPKPPRLAAATLISWAGENAAHGAKTVRVTVEVLERL